MQPSCPRRLRSPSISPRPRDGPLPRQTLLLLDNCEHVDAAVADLVFVLLAGLDDIQTALYSRIRAPELDQMACNSASPSTACPTSQARPTASSTV
jgi:hypothetical protein